MDTKDLKSGRAWPRYLYNRDDLPTLRSRLKTERAPRVTVSFYQYASVESPEELRNHFFLKWEPWGVLGRIYIAKEGINAQLSVLKENYAALERSVREVFPNIIFKEAIEDQHESFFKLVIKVRNKIVADGLDDGAFDTSNVGRHLNAEEFNAAMEQEGTIVVDVRNHYESEIGHFQGALRPDVDTFRDELPAIKSMLEGKEDHKILLYCTGGIRCEKASAWLRHEGFKDVNQLHGGIIDYARQVREKNLECKFTGKNFVFDNRLGERITDDVIAHCHVCDQPADSHTNCCWQGCHVLLIMCEECHRRLDGCCSEECLAKTKLPEDEQVRLRKSLAEPPRRFSKGRRRSTHEIG